MPKLSRFVLLSAVALLSSSCSNSELETVSSEVLTARVQVNGVTPQLERTRADLSTVDMNTELGRAIKSEGIDLRLAAVAKRYSTAQVSLRSAELAVKEELAPQAKKVMVDRFAPEFKGVPEDVASLSGRFRLLAETSKKRGKELPELQKAVSGGVSRAEKLSKALPGLKRQYPTYAEKFEGLGERVKSLQESLVQIKPVLKTADLQGYVIVADRIATSVAGLDAVERSMVQLREDLESERTIVVSKLTTEFKVVVGRSCWDEDEDYPAEHTTSFPARQVPAGQFQYVSAAFEGLKDGSGTIVLGKIKRSGVDIAAPQKLWSLISVPVDQDLWQGGDDHCMVYVDDAYRQFFAVITESVNGSAIHTSTEEVDEGFYKKTAPGELLFKKTKGRLSEDAEIQKL